MKKEEKKINKEMSIGEVVVKFPEAIPVMLRAGLHCVGCHVAAYETVEQGAAAHGMDEKQIKNMVDEMNKVIEDIDEDTD